jgi:hypothetical protein
VSFGASLRWKLQYSLHRIVYTARCVLHFRLVLHPNA